jgi:GNAT superfamily N-acetyltransferase
VVLEDGRTVVVRGLLGTEVDGIRRMLSRSSPETLYRRFLSPLPEVPEHVLALLADPDRPDGATLVALAGQEIVGHAMYACLGGEDGHEAEVALVVEDAWQSNGKGKLLLAEIAIEARRQGVEVLACVALGDNRRVLGLAQAVFSEIECEIKDGGCLMRASPWSLRPSVLGGAAKTQQCWDRTEHFESIHGGEKEASQ